MAREPSAALAAARYINLVTFRRDGREVATPVWCAGLGGKIYVYTAGGAGKTKRIRATGRVRAAPCTMGGRITGDWAEGEGRVVEDGETIRKAMRAIRREYGWVYLLTTLLAAVTGRVRRRAVLELNFPA